MHDSCKKRIEWFFENYLEYFPKHSDGKVHILDVGGGNINGTYDYDKTKILIECLNIEKIPGVDIIVDNPYKWDIEDEKYDAVISLNTFQHIEYFWKTIEEISRVLKKNGFFAMISPSNRYDGKYPTACWAFNIDGLKAMAKWGNLKLVDASIAGIPNSNASSEWDYSLDDAFLIAIKSEKNVEFPKMLEERRFSEYRYTDLEKKLQRKHFVMSQWIDNLAQGKKISSYLSEMEVKNIAIYGAGEFGILLAKELINANLNFSYFIDKNADVLSKTQNDHRIYTLDQIPNNITRGIVIVSVVGDLDNLKAELEKNFSNVMFLEDVVFEVSNR